jgi:hypothetical protein
LVRKDDVIPLALFLATCVGITEVTEALRRVLDRTIRAEQENALLLQELEHRTKNDLHMVASVLGLQANSHADPAVQAAPEARLAGFRSLPMRTIVSNGGIRLPW